MLFSGCPSAIPRLVASLVVVAFERCADWRLSEIFEECGELLPPLADKDSAFDVVKVLCDTVEHAAPDSICARSFAAVSWTNAAARDDPSTGEVVAAGDALAAAVATASPSSVAQGSRYPLPNGELSKPLVREVDSL